MSFAVSCRNVTYCIVGNFQRLKFLQIKNFSDLYFWNFATANPVIFATKYQPSDLYFFENFSIQNFLALRKVLLYNRLKG